MADDLLEDEELIQDFLVEAGEFIEQLDQDLIQLEENPENLQLLDQIFRAVHTIKGNAGFLGFDKLTEFTHQTENVLDKLRSGEMKVTPPIMDLILESVDIMKALMENLNNEDAVDTLATVEKLKNARNPSTKKKKKSTKKKETIPPPPLAEEDDDMVEIIQDFLVEAGEFIEQLDQDLIQLEENPEDLQLLDQIFRAVHTIKGNAGFLGFDRLTEFTHQTENVLDKLRSGEMKITPPIMDLILESVDIMKALMENLNNEDAVDTFATIKKLQACLRGELLEEQKIRSSTANVPPSPKKEDTKRKSHEEQTIRVDIRRLDDLMNLAGELVIAKNRLQQFHSQFEEMFTDSDLSEFLMLTTGMINYVTAQFQESVMKTRMLPIKKVFSRIPRMVRDLSRETNKKVELVVRGEDTELDKSVIEHIGDPLMHIIRNAIDHGLETPEQRKKSGKEACGTIHLNAYSEGNYIIIEVADDGKGMDPDAILKKALSKNLITEEDAGRLSERGKLDFIFAPGFSTAETISDISGRGVGMNVVKENIERLDGLIDIYTAIGQGTTFKIQLPLTMAIVPALMVQAGPSTFAIPLANIIETLVVAPQEIYMLDRKEVIYLRDQIISVVRLNELLQLEKDLVIQEKNHILILGVAEQRLGLMVNRIMGQEEVVIKSLGPFFGDINIIAGATIMGDGSVVLILNVASIIHRVSRKIPLGVN